MGGPVVIAHGTEEQKQRYLEPILSGEEIWCQGFSEPEAGSDLASLKTKAVKDGDEWVVTGQKVWTTLAHEAKWCMLVARTDPDAPKHKGLTYFLMDMEQDAVQINPLHQITGEAEFNELFLEEARIPDANVVGGVGNGWGVAITTLMNERAGLGAGAAATMKIALGQLIELAKERGVDSDPLVRQKIAGAADRGRGAAPERLARPDRDHEDRHPRPRGLAAQAAVVGRQPGPDRAGHGDPRRGGGRQGLRLDLPLPARPGQLDRGRHHRDPQEHHRRARPEPAEAASPMNFDYDDDQQAIKRTAHDMLVARFKPDTVRELAEGERYDEAHWDELCELGWPGIFIDEQYEGQGLGTVELVILLEELGYTLAPVPFLSNAAAGLALQYAGSDEQKDAHLKGIATGAERGTVGHAARTASPSWCPTPTPPR